jgi:3-phosphoshikimate 1-carboxyvinyltransferase
MTSAAVEALRLPLDRLPDPLPIPPLRPGRGKAPVHASIRPPGSKSLTNRALLLAALAEGTSTLRAPLLGADDAERMLEAIAVLGARVERVGADGLRVTGVGGRWVVPGEGVRLNLNNAGTATRFLAASALLASGPMTIDGNERMRARPIGELIGALRQLGARVEELGSAGCPPIRVHPLEGPPEGGVLRFGRTQSSQFISALAMVATCLPGGLTLDVGNEPTSASYLA